MSRAGGPVTYRPPNPVECPKCKYISGDDWRQCEGKCPMPCSPHFDEGTAQVFNKVPLATRDENTNLVDTVLKDIDPELFELEAACAILSNLEHEPPDQISSDTLWVELRLACAAVRALTRERDELQKVLDEIYAERGAVVAEPFRAALRSEEP